MKPTYNGFEAKKNSGDFTQLPPPGAYVAKIMSVRFLAKDGDKQQRDQIELFLDIIEGDYTGRFVEVWNDQKEKFGDKVPYKGIVRLTPPVEGDEDWRYRNFEGNIWCVQESNPGYTWDWDENKLKDKIVGINLRQRLYTYTNSKGETKDGETVEIARFETVADVRSGKVKTAKPRDQRQKHDEETEDNSNDGGFTDVSKDVNVPW